MRATFLLGVLLTVGCEKNNKPDTLPEQAAGSSALRRVDPARDETAKREAVEPVPPEIRLGESVKLGPVTLKF